MEKAEIVLDVSFGTYANRPACEQLTITLLMSAVPIVPEPLCTTQVCAGLDGWVRTVTEYAPP